MEVVGFLQQQSEQQLEFTLFRLQSFYFYSKSHQQFRCVYQRLRLVLAGDLSPPHAACVMYGHIFRRHFTYQCQDRVVGVDTSTDVRLTSCNDPNSPLIRCRSQTYTNQTRCLVFPSFSGADKKEKKNGQPINIE